MRKQKIVCIGGPTGAGKDTIVSAFLKEEAGFVRIPRSTTRPSRLDEIEGVHYYFLSREEFCKKESCGYIHAVDSFLGHLYGVDIRKIYDALEIEKNVIGVFGICSLTLRKIFAQAQNCMLIYLCAPILMLEVRLIERGDSFDQISARMQAAEKQMEEEPQFFDHILENTGPISLAVSRLQQLIYSR